MMMKNKAPLILFPRRKGVKIATHIIFKEMENVCQSSSSSYFLVLGMILFAARFGAISYDEQVALTAHLNEKMRFKG